MSSKKQWGDPSVTPSMEIKNHLENNQNVMQSQVISRVRLRDYQVECIDSILNNYSQGKCRQLISLPTGSGKTVIFASLIKRLNKKTLVIAHTNELVEQAQSKIRMIAPEIETGVVNQSKKEVKAQVVIATIQSARSEKTLAILQQQDFDILIYDECHHAPSEKSRECLNALGFGPETKKLLVGFSATAYQRQDGRGLGEIFDSVVYERSVSEMIDAGYLCQPKGIKIDADVDLSLVTKDGWGDFEAESLADVMDTQELRDLLVESYIEKGEGRKTICFGTNIRHAKNLSEDFNAKGISSACIHGGMGKIQRESILRDYRNDEIQVLTNCQILTEGFDSPSTSCVIVGRPTQSTALYVQMVGRGLRTWMNKQNCLIIDFNPKDHVICNSAILTKDAESVGAQLHEPRSVFFEGEDLPINLNQKLKTALKNFNPLGQTFTWSKVNGVYTLKGLDCELQVRPSGDLFKVVYLSVFEKTLASGMDFEFAISIAEDFARDNRKQFTVSDRNASWRSLPPSEKQLDYIRKRGYRTGIETLTRGQCADLISSGVLKRA